MSSTIDLRIIELLLLILEDIIPAFDLLSTQVNIYICNRRFGRKSNDRDVDCSFVIPTAFK